MSSNWPRITQVSTVRRDNFNFRQSQDYTSMPFSKVNNVVMRLLPDTQLRLLEMDISYGPYSNVDATGVWHYALVTCDANNMTSTDIGDFIAADRCYWIALQAYVEFGTAGNMMQTITKDTVDWYNPPVISTHDMNPIPYEKVLAFMIDASYSGSEGQMIAATIYYEVIYDIIEWGNDGYTYNTDDQKDGSNVGWEEWQHWD